MGLRDRFRAGFEAFFSVGQRQPAVVEGITIPVPDFDLPLQPEPPLIIAAEPTEALVARRESAGTAVAQRRSDLRQAEESISLGMGMSLDADDPYYRRLTGDAKSKRRDLSPLQQDRMLEIVWYLWEQNPFARRLITLMTDLILGGGWQVEAADERIQTEIDATWNHRVNQLSVRCREFHNALALNGELILTVAVNPVTGRPEIGFIDPYQVKDIQPIPDNVLVPDVLILKAERGQEEKRLKIVRENPLTERLEGEVFYFGVNKLPNSLRGRSDIMALADWLDLYDQYLFAEVERLHLLSAFVWDYEITGATDDKAIAEKLKKFPVPKPGSVFAHNEKEKLEARTPDLKAQDRSEAGRMLRTHIAGSYGFPLSYLGEIDSNKASIEGQNDILLKTPAARQVEFAGFLDQIVRFTIDSTTTKNPSLFRDADPGYRIRVPEIAAKDIARVGTVLAQVVGAMDTSMANHTASKKLTVQVLVAMLKQLGVEADPNEILADAELDAEDAQAMADAMQAQIAAQRVSGGTGGNPPVEDDPAPEDQPGAKPPKGGKQEGSVHVEAAPIQVTVHPANIEVHQPDVVVNVPSPNVRRVTTVERDGNNLIKSTETTDTHI